MTDIQKEKIKRLIQIRKFFGLNQLQMAQKIGLKQPNLSAIENIKAGQDILNDIHYVLEDKLGVNRNWFLTGEGEMIGANTNRIMSQESIEGYIPVYDVTFTLGFNPTFIDSRDSLEVLGYVNFPELIGSTYVVRAKGDSMAPLINDKDFVGIRPVKNKGTIDFGNPYGIITEDLAIFKRITPGNVESRINLVSENPKHAPYEIDKSEVIHLFSVIGILSVKSITY